jgi:outer membrane lipoprotein-sorting protein
MKRTIWVFLAAAALVAASFSSLTASADAQLDHVLDQMQQNAKDIKFLQANLRQEKRNVQIGGRPEVYSGMLYFQHGKGGSDRVRINYDNGDQVSVDGSTITLYQPKINQVIITSRQKQAAKNQEFSFIATPYKSVPQLKSQYNVAYLGEEAGAAKLELTPKAKSSVKKLTLWVDQSNWMPTRYQVITQNDVSTFILSNVQKNVAVGPGMFKIKVKSGTKEIRP